MSTMEPFESSLQFRLGKGKGGGMGLNINKEASYSLVPAIQVALSLTLIQYVCWLKGPHLYLQ